MVTKGTGIDEKFVASSALLTNFGCAECDLVCCERPMKRTVKQKQPQRRQPRRKCDFRSSFLFSC